jgi:hypothetical protein
MNTYYRGSKRLNSIEANEKAASVPLGKVEGYKGSEQARVSEEVSKPLSSRRDLTVETILEEKLTASGNNVPNSTMRLRS